MTGYTDMTQGPLFAFDNTSSSVAVLPARISWYDKPVQSKPKPGGKSLLTMFSIAFIASPELLPGAWEPTILIDA